MRNPLTIPILLAAGTLGAAVPASARNAPETNQSGATQAAPAPAQAQDQADPDRRICVDERLSDSRMRRRICHTAREWQELQGEGGGR